MAIATTILGRTVEGNYMHIYGKSVLSGTTNTGDVITGLSQVIYFQMNVQGATQKGCLVNKTLPLASGTVTAVVESNDGTFYWEAVGV